MRVTRSQKEWLGFVLCLLFVAGALWLVRYAVGEVVKARVPRVQEVRLVLPDPVVACIRSTDTVEGGGV